MIRADVLPLLVALGVTSVAPRPAPPALVVHCDAPAHAINPLVYGIAAQSIDGKLGQWETGAAARRWGGNHTSRYNWRLGNATNKGKDWFFENVDFGGSWERFVDDDRANGASTTITVPTIGWVAKDTTSYGFPVSVYGPQRETGPESADIGDGVFATGALVAPTMPERTSVAWTPADVADWARALAARGVHSYILDNEPMLWNETHRDVHPSPVSYDELLRRTIAYAAAIRGADKDAVIAGPALWGWDATQRSAVDKASPRTQPDRRAHGDVALLPWWLSRVRAEEKRTGTKLVDLVDVHFYPQGDGIGIGAGGATDPDTSARRIRSTRALWDPTYRDESWIREPVALVPHLKKWIDESAPGVGVSIGEYNFGAETHMSGGLAVAEALGRFGALGVTSAYYWDSPERESPAFWAFRAYRNYDGHGARFLDESVAAESNDPSVSIFASRNAARDRVVLVILELDPKKTVAPKIDTSSCGEVVSKRAFVYTGGAAGFAPTSAASLPPYSITVVELALARRP